MAKLDFLIVGAGLFGSTFARLVAEKGYNVYVIEKRNHIGGNCYTEKIEGINVHKYGAHIFHTNNSEIWEFINRFSSFNNYQHRVKVLFDNKVYSFPINLMTLHQLWGTKTPEEANKKLESVKIKNSNPKNLEDWILSEVGEEIYCKFIKEYTRKQWNKDPKYLPASIIKRIPIRMTFDDRYFSDKYQGTPTDGYTAIFEKMLDHPKIKKEINVDFFDNKKELINCCNNIVYTGKIDEFYDYKFGKLEYRSLKFESKVLDGDYQGCSVMNYTGKNQNFTRILEHKHFELKENKKTIITHEYPENYTGKNIPYYPINDENNNKIYERYKKLNKNKKIIFGGRLGKYQYMDMHQVIGAAMKSAEESTLSC